MGMFYRTVGEEKADKLQLRGLLSAVNGAKNAIGKNECTQWQIAGIRGHVIAWGDGKAFALWRGCRSKQHWTYFKKSIPPGLGVVTQDGDAEGVIKLNRFPQGEDEAAWFRSAIGLRQTHDARSSAFKPDGNGTFST